MMYAEQQRDVFRDRLGHILKKHEITESLKSFEQDQKTDFRPDAFGDLRGKGEIISRGGIDNSLSEKEFLRRG